MSQFAPAKVGRQARGVAGYDDDNGRKRKLAAETAAAFAPLPASHASVATGDKCVDKLQAVLDPVAIDEHLRNPAACTQFKLTVTDENTLMCYVDAALAYAGKDGLCCGGDPTKLPAAFAQLKGCLMPIVGKVNKKRAQTSEYDPSKNPNFADFQFGKPHDTMLHPTLLLLRPTDATIRGGCVALLLPVTRQGFNFPIGDDRRAACAKVLPAYWDAMAVTMCVHVYDDVDARLWDSFSTTTKADGLPLELDPANELDPEKGTDPFLFKLYREMSDVKAIPYGTSKRLQIPGMVRSMSTLSVTDGHAVLTGLLGQGAGAWREFMGTRQLAYGEVWEVHAKVESAAKVPKSKKYAMHRDYPSGDEVRNYMFTHRALRNTPLAPLLLGAGSDAPMAASMPWPESLDIGRFLQCLRDSTAWASEELA